MPLHAPSRRPTACDEECGEGGNHHAARTRARTPMKAVPLSGELRRVFYAVAVRRHESRTAIRHRDHDRWCSENPSLCKNFTAELHEMPTSLRVDFEKIGV